VSAIRRAIPSLRSQASIMSSRAPSQPTATWRGFEKGLRVFRRAPAGCPRPNTQHIAVGVEPLAVESREYASGRHARDEIEAARKSPPSSRRGVPRGHVEAARPAPARHAPSIGGITGR
jgi:hypothetical protein